jgi:predicted dehydrogenase
MTRKLGFIGLKGHESVVLRGAAELNKVTPAAIEIVAVADDVPGELAKFAKQPQLKGAQAYPEWRQLLEHAMLDVVCLSDANDLHTEQIIECARRNIDIVTEKPLALNLEDLTRVNAALAKSKSRLTMLLTMRHEAKYSVVRRLVQEGAIGDVAQVTAQKSYRLEKRPAWFKQAKRLGGMIPYIGIHPVDLIRWTTGLDIQSVAAVQGRTGEFPELGEGDNQASLLATLSNGASATIRLDYLRPSTTATHGDDCLRIAGSKGIIETRGDVSTISLLSSDKEPQTIQPDKPTNLFVEFLAALDASKPWPIPAEDCLRATEIVLLARQAAEERAVMKIPEFRK